VIREALSLVQIVGHIRGPAARKFVILGCESGRCRLEMIMGKPMQKIITFYPNDPCPCESGKLLCDCHMGPDGRFWNPRPLLRAPGQPTGYAHPGCYLRGTNDCSHQISREHYVSKSVLKQLGDLLGVTGLPRQDTDAVLKTTARSLTAKILCQRHNSALSPLDTEAATFFHHLAESIDDLNRKTLSRRRRIHLVNGEALELWMLKLACGLYFSVGSKGGKRIDKTHSIDLGKVGRALFEGKWDPCAGLYFQGVFGGKATDASYVAIGPVTVEQIPRCTGAIAFFNGFIFELLFDTKEVDPGPRWGLVHRPGEIVLAKKQREHRLFLTWPAGTPEASVTLRRDWWRLPHGQET